jgi:hypothetical protein
LQFNTLLVKNQAVAAKRGWRGTPWVKNPTAAEHRSGELSDTGKGGEAKIGTAMEAE